MTGGGSRVRIRGTSSLSLSNDPIYVIDGIRMTSNRSDAAIGVGGTQPSRVNDISPEEIENIEIVKGPSAATLYGTDAANGVIVITTRKGRAGRSSMVILQRSRLDRGQQHLSHAVRHPRAHGGESHDADPLLPEGRLRRHVHQGQHGDVERLRAIRKRRRSPTVTATCSASSSSAEPRPFATSSPATSRTKRASSSCRGSPARTSTPSARRFPRSGCVRT